MEYTEIVICTATEGEGHEANERIMVYFRLGNHVQYKR